MNEAFKWTSYIAWLCWWCQVTHPPAWGLEASCVCTLCILIFQQQNMAGSNAAFLAFLLQSSAKSSSPEKKKFNLIRFSHHDHLDPRDLLTIALPAGNTREGLLQPLTNSCQEGFTSVTVMLCKIKFSLTKSSCKRTTIPVFDENLNDWIVCCVLF